jgi:hypothetical protein
VQWRMASWVFSLVRVAPAVEGARPWLVAAVYLEGSGELALRLWDAMPCHFYLTMPYFAHHAIPGPAPYTHETSRFPLGETPTLRVGGVKVGV